MSTTKKALLIGCNYLNDPNNRLNGCINDVINMTNTLVDAFDYDLDNIIVLRDDSTFSNSIPTRSNILARLYSLAQQSSLLSEIWVHYSGHGSQVRDTNNDETDGLDEVIVPVDFKTAGFIRDDEFFSILQTFSVKCRVILLFDSCNSGSMCDLQHVFRVSGNNIIRSITSRKLLNHPNIFCFSGCKDEQTSADAYSPLEMRSVGAFTNTFLYCLRLNHFNVDVFKLYADICKTILQSGFTQTPVFSSSSLTPNLVLGRVTYRSTATLSRPNPPLLNSPLVTGNNREVIKSLSTFFFLPSNNNPIPKIKMNFS